MCRCRSFGSFEVAHRRAAEQKARTTYDNLLRLVDDPDVRDPIKFLRQREITHFQRFGEANHTKLSSRKKDRQSSIWMMWNNLM